jgi:hypothetical protein
MSDWATIGVTAVLGVSGLYLGQSVRRKTRAEVEAHVAERRLQAYGDLWQRTITAAPSNGKALTEHERSSLYGALTEWYFAQGNGMVLSEDTRAIYLTVKNNLVCPAHDVQPKALRHSIEAAEPGEADALRGEALVRQLSLMRTSMRADLLVYSGPWGRKLGQDDRRFLAACGISRWHRPWRPTLRRVPRAQVGVMLPPDRTPVADQPVSTERTAVP